MRRLWGRGGVWSLGLLPLIAVLLLWQAVGDPADPFFPAPSAWFDRLEWGGADGLLRRVSSTLAVFALGVLLALVVGFFAGIACGRSPLLDSLTGPMLEFLRAVPAPTIVPIVILFAGPGTTTLVVAAAFAAVWPILLNAAHSSRTLEPVLIDSARVLRLSRLSWLRKVVVPACLPGAMVGMRTALPIALVVTLLAEMLTGAPGIGGALMQAQRSYETATAYGLLTVAGAMGLAVAALFSFLERTSLRALRG